MERRRLPCLPFADFLLALDAIVPSTPERIDSSCWTHLPRLSGKAPALCDAMEFLGLIRSTGEVLEPLQRLLNPLSRVAELKATLARSYPFLNQERLRRMTMKQLEQEFRQQAPGTAIFRKARSFYLKAAEAAGLDLPPGAVRNRLPIPIRSHQNSRPTSSTLLKTNFATLGLQGGGKAAIVIIGQRLDDLTVDELKRLSKSAILLKSGRKPPSRQERQSHPVANGISGADERT